MCHATNNANLNLHFGSVLDENIVWKFCFHEINITLWKWLHKLEFCDLDTLIKIILLIFITLKLQIHMKIFFCVWYIYIICQINIKICNKLEIIIVIFSLMFYHQLGWIDTFICEWSCTCYKSWFKTWC